MSTSTAKSIGRGRGHRRGRGKPNINNNYQTQQEGPGRKNLQEEVLPVVEQKGVEPPLETRPSEESRPRPKQVTGSTLLSTQVAKRNEAFSLPKRPDFGTVGRRILLRTNFFEVTLPDRDIYQYDVTIEPSKCPASLNRIIIENMVRVHGNIFGDDKPVYDGKKNLYAMRALAFGNDTASLDVNFFDEDRQRERIFKVFIKLVSRVSLDQLKEAVQGKCSVPYQVIHAVDVALRHLPSLRYVPVGRSFFSAPDFPKPSELGLGREVWQGYHQSIRPGQWKVMLNIDSSATAFYKSQTVIDFLIEVIDRRNFAEIEQRQLKDQDRMKFSREIKGLRVEVTHLGKQKRKYRIIGVSKEPVSKRTFLKDTADGKKVEITVAAYFKDQYKINLRYPNLPCLQTSNKSFLPMEVCNIVAGQRCVKKLNEKQTSDMIRLTARNAQSRQKDIMDLVEKADFKRDEYLQRFGIKVSKDMTRVEGRVLPAPKISYGKESITPRNGAWHLRNNTFYEAGKIQSWGVVVFTMLRECPMSKLNVFIESFVKISNGMGIKTCNKPSFCEYFRNGSLVEEIFKRAQSCKLKLLLAVLPGTTPYYAQIKQFGDTKYGISTQCVQLKNVLYVKPQTVENICQKVNAKLGGINASIDHSCRPIIMRKPVIFLGADVTHPAPGDNQNPSIAAVVGSIDKYPMKYHTSIRAQQHRQEIIADLCEMTKASLLAFFRSKRCKPEKIVMYRDGVSEGQFEQVVQQEVAAIQKACIELEKEYQPGITFIVVQKRHHAKFFPESDGDKIGKSGNIPAGTTVEKGICHPTENDFYLCSHAGIQGTSKPAHYHVLWDDNQLMADELQKLTYMLCHTYVRCTRSVSIPSPAYYAHLAAFRARYYLEQQQDSGASSCSGHGAKPKTQLDKDTLEKLSNYCKAHFDLAETIFYA